MQSNSLSFIETQFPVSRLSKESYKERDAKNGQTLTPPWEVVGKEAAHHGASRHPRTAHCLHRRTLARIVTRIPCPADHG